MISYFDWLRIKKLDGYNVIKFIQSRRFGDIYLYKRKFDNLSDYIKFRDLENWNLKSF
jgi:hypothetical protein